MTAAILISIFGGTVAGMLVIGIIGTYRIMNKSKPPITETDE